MKRRHSIGQIYRALELRFVQTEQVADMTVDRLIDETKDEARLWCQAGAKYPAALVVNPSSE